MKRQHGKSLHLGDALVLEASQIHEQQVGRESQTIWGHIVQKMVIICAQIHAVFFLTIFLPFWEASLALRAANPLTPDNKNLLDFSPNNPISPASHFFTFLFPPPLFSLLTDPSDLNADYTLTVALLLGHQGFPSLFNLGHRIRHALPFIGHRSRRRDLVMLTYVVHTQFRVVLLREWDPWRWRP